MSDATNVVILVFDTLRSDHLGCYGADVRTPAFDSMADRGTFFRSAFGTAPGTPISHASLYTGQYPTEHGVTGQYIPLPADLPVLAEWFRDAGYDTFGITGPSKMGSDWDYDRGFDDLYESYYDHPSVLSVDGLRTALTDWTYAKYVFRELTRREPDLTRFKFDLLERTLGDLDRPFFALCNVTTVHAPFQPPYPYRMEANPDYSRSRWRLVEWLLDRSDRIGDPAVRLDRVERIRSSEGIGRLLADPEYLNDAEVQLLRDWYRAAVEFLDDEFARFLEFYRENLREDTILVVTADHGEQLGEHDLWVHSYYLYDETLKVPLIFEGPGVPSGTRRDDLASHVDVFDTLCDSCGIDPPPTTSGHSLWGNTERDAVFMEYGVRDEEAFAEHSGHARYFDDDQLSRFAAGRKGIRTADYRLEMSSRGEERVVDVESGRETESVPRPVRNSLRERLLETLGEEFGPWPEGDPEDVHMSDEVEENLRELGYL